MNYSELPKIFLSFALILGLLGGTKTTYADETADLKNQIKALQQKVDELEKKQLSNQPQANAQVSSPEPRFAYDPWDPLVQMQVMERRMGQMLKDNMVDFNPREDIKQTPDAYIISLDIPGMDKDNINVEVKKGMLIVSGDRTSEVKEDQPNKVYRQERSFGHFYRALDLPEDVKADAIDAQYSNGVLTIKVPRTKNTNPASGGQKIKVK